MWYRVTTGTGGASTPWQKVKSKTEWRRYSVGIRTSPKGGTLHVAIRTEGAQKFRGRGRAPLFWLDAAQFEQSSEPTEYVADCYSLDSMGWLALERQ